MHDAVWLWELLVEIDKFPGSILIGRFADCKDPVDFS
jgi:hypothetical protein